MSKVVVVGLVVVAMTSLATERQPFVSRDVLDARARWRAGDVASARALAESALPRLRHQVAAAPADPDRHMALAEALALVGRGREALAEARTALATDAAPAAARSTRDAGSLLETMVIVAMEAGATDEALDAVEILLARGPRPGATPIAEDERFAPLRADPRFSHLVSLYGAPSAAPTL